MLHGHGDDAYLFDREIVADFSTNVWHKGTDQRLLNYLLQQQKKIGNYPEPSAESLAKAIASFHQLEETHALPTNGATEAFYLLAHWNRESPATIFYPTFAEYEDACLLHRCQMTYLPYRTINELPTLPKGMAFICHPNNPDGRATELSTLKKLIQQNEQTLFVIDEAYIDFAPSVESTVPYIKELENLVVVKSLTKTFAMPGLRLGYVLGNEKVIRELTRLKMPWSVNALAVEAGKFIMDNYDALKPDMGNILSEKAALITALAKIHDLEISPSHTHYFLLKHKAQKAADLKLKLVNEHGILIRNASNFRGLSEFHFRLATLSTNKNQLLLDALNQ
ncbi:aminotransferase class I/II-fold pyridoxal phosphate-dependent enzyme [Flammeovirgaceae bacterium SG7u.111]|nr:aminotransferase class I/II-fold pyridoxal phosphate-dependent enzyme [Flammeovirgaceae bacterium SG7u.132]WPO37081.1 aminotransferase class I/II-fold pyridoxal phosphate-dependent enzyme [Flammeovirgaceae bacterium SG7u.111]